MKLSEKDIRLLEMLQKDCKRSLKEMARDVKSPVTTVYERIKRFEKEGIIKKYEAVVDGGKVGKPLTAFVFLRVEYHPLGESNPLSQRELAKQIAKYPNVQEVHMITGDWDILLKIKGKDVDEIGSFILDELRSIKGIGRTFTSTCLQVVKEGAEISLK